MQTILSVLRWLGARLLSILAGPKPVHPRDDPHNDAGPPPTPPR